METLGERWSAHRAERTYRITGNAGDWIDVPTEALLLLLSPSTSLSPTLAVAVDVSLLVARRKSHNLRNAPSHPSRTS